jgi:hypothetical protein
MPYPSPYTRLTNFLRAANNGLVSPAPADVDAELNNIQVVLSQMRTRLQAITTADGRLQNVAQAIAQSLVGSWTGPAPASPGPIVTDIPWDSVFSNESVLVVVGSVPQHTTAITVADSGGFVAVTPAPYPSTGATVTVWAFEPGAGILTRLASTGAGDGASLIGVADAGGLIDATDTEGALQELAAEADALVVALGPLGEYFKRDGSVAATGDFDLGGFKVTAAADGVNDGDYVTVRQIANYIAAWADLARYFLKRDGTTAMAGPLNFGNSKGYNLADPDISAPLDAVNVRTLLKTIATSGAAPVGTVVDYAGTVPPTNWLLSDGQAYLGTAYPVLYDLLPVSMKSGNAQGAQVAVYPALIAGNLSGTPGALTSIPTMTVAGIGYTGAPVIRVVNPVDKAAVVTQPTFSVSLTPVVLDGPNILSGGELTVTIVSGGSGIYPGATLIVDNSLVASPGTAALAQLPTGYFRTPDLRGRVTLGAGTESRSPGITDPPDLTKGDSYNATPRVVGAIGGEASHRLLSTEIPLGTSVVANGSTYRPVVSTGTNVAHNTLPPFVVLNKIIKAA